MEYNPSSRTLEERFGSLCIKCKKPTSTSIQGGKLVLPDDLLKDAEVIVLKRPPWGYCCMKRIHQLHNPKYSHLPHFATAEEHGSGNPVDLRKHNGELIVTIPWVEFHNLYEID